MEINESWLVGAIRQDWDNRFGQSFVRHLLHKYIQELRELRAFGGK